MDELDRILSGDPHIEPSSGFSADVMRAVSLSARTPSPLPFPWGRVVTGSVTCGVLGWAGPFATTPAEAETWAIVAEALAPALPGLSYAALTLCVVSIGLGLQRLNPSATRSPRASSARTAQWRR